ncbi:Chorein N-terminal domain-containing protein [Entamoeba marina]
MDLIASKLLKRFLKTFIESCSDWGTGNDIDITPTKGIITLHNISFIKDVFKNGFITISTQAENCHMQFNTILVEITLFKLALRLGSSTLNLVVEGGETWFADSQFRKIDNFPHEKSIGGIFYSYRFLQINNLTMKFKTLDNEVTLCERMEVTGKITIQHDPNKYQLLDTSIIVDLSNISLNLSMDDYINLIWYVQTLFGIATESAVIDVINSSTPTNNLVPSRINICEELVPQKIVPTHAHKNPVSLSPSPINESYANGNKIQRSQTTTLFATTPTHHEPALKKSRKEKKVERMKEKKLQKQERKGEPRLLFRIKIPFVKLSLKNDEISEKICWLFSGLTVTFVPAFGGRIKVGSYDYQIETIEGLFVSGKDVKPIIWGLEQSEGECMLKTKATTTWNRKMFCKTTLYAELRFVGVTMEFQLLKALVEFLKVTVFNKFSNQNVDVVGIVDQIEKAIELTQTKWEILLNILQLSSVLDLLKRIGVDFKLYGCRFEGVIPETENNFAIVFDDVTLTNTPIWSKLSVKKTLESKLKHQLRIRKLVAPESIKLHAVLGSFSVMFIENGKISYLFPPTHSIFQMQIVFNVNDTVPALILVKHSFENLTNIDDITDTVLNFVDTSIIPTIFSNYLPAFGLEVVLNKGVVSIPITAIVETDKILESDDTTKMVVSGLTYCFSTDEESHNVGVFIDKIITENIEEILSPFEGITSREPSQWLPLMENPNFSLIWKYDKTQKETERVMSVDLVLYNVEVKLNKLLGIEMEKIFDTPEEDYNIFEPLAMSTKLTSMIPDEYVTQTIQEVVTTKSQNMLMEWFSKKYKGMMFFVNISDCRLTARDNRNSASVSTSNLYEKQTEEIITQLKDELQMKKHQKKQLQQERADLLRQINKYQSKSIYLKTSNKN